MKYTYEIVETLVKLVTVDAPSEGDAYREVKRMYHEEEIVLDDTNFLSVEINSMEII